MKILICSDLHGSAFYAQKIIDIFNRENAEKLIFLGDIYNHGPRNPLPKDYAPLKVAENLNAIKDKLIVVKGNCDSQVDTMISDFDFVEDMCILDGGKTLFLTHGHVYNKDNLPKTKYSAVIYGHFHTGFIEKINDIVVANAGSLSLPKNDTPNSYLLFDNGALLLKDLEGNVINSVKL
jgi:putative phosphoesterase